MTLVVQEGAPPGWRELPSEARWFLASRAASAASLGACVVLMNLFLDARGLDARFIGASYAVFSASVALGALAAGRWADRRRPRSLVALGEAVLGASLLGQVLSASPGAVLAWSAVAGLGTATVAVAAQPYQAAVAGARGRTVVFSLAYALFLGMGVLGNLGAVAAGWLTPSLGVLGAYRAVLAAAAALNFVACGLVLGTSTSEARDLDLGSDPSEGEEGPSQASARGLLSYGGMELLVGLGAGLSVPFFNLYFKRGVGLEVGAIGAVFALQGLVAAGAAATGPSWARRLGSARAVCLLQALSLVPLVALAAVTSPWLAVPAFVLRAALMRTSTPLFRAFVMGRMPPGFRGRAASVTTSLWYGGQAAGTWVSGHVIASGSWGLAFLGTALAYGTAALWLWGREVGWSSRGRRGNVDG